MLSFFAWALSFVFLRLFRWDGILGLHSVGLQLLLLVAGHAAVLPGTSLLSWPRWLPSVADLNSVISVLSHALEEVGDDLVVPLVLLRSVLLVLGIRVGGSSLLPLLLPGHGFRSISWSLLGKLRLIGLPFLGVSARLGLLLQQLCHAPTPAALVGHVLQFLSPEFGHFNLILLHVLIL